MSSSNGTVSQALGADLVLELTAVPARIAERDEGRRAGPRRAPWPRDVARGGDLDASETLRVESQLAAGGMERRSRGRSATARRAAPPGRWLAGWRAVDLELLETSPSFIGSGLLSTSPSAPGRLCSQIRATVCAKFRVGPSPASRSAAGWSGSRLGHDPVWACERGSRNCLTPPAPPGRRGTATRRRSAASCWRRQLARKRVEGLDSRRIAAPPRRSPSCRWCAGCPSSQQTAVGADRHFEHRRPGACVRAAWGKFRVPTALSCASSHPGRSATSDFARIRGDPEPA